MTNTGERIRFLRNLRGIGDTTLGALIDRRKLCRK